MTTPVERSPPVDSRLECTASYCDLLGVPDGERGEHLLKVSLIVFGPQANLGERWGSHAESMRFNMPKAWGYDHS